MFVWKKITVLGTDMYNMYKTLRDFVKYREQLTIWPAEQQKSICQLVVIEGPIISYYCNKPSLFSSEHIITVENKCALTY